MIEEYSIVGLSHGAPLDTRGSHHGEIAAPFMLEAGISSTRLIGRFWSIVPDEVAIRSLKPAPPLRATRPQPQAAEAPAESQAFIKKTIEDALRSAGLMK